jgi:hypothetical protein
VLFHDARGDASQGDWWLRTSTDRGLSWREQHVGGPFELATAPLFGMFPLGDYFGLVATSDGLLAVAPETTPAAARGVTDVFSTPLQRSDGQR